MKTNIPDNYESDFDLNIFIQRLDELKSEHKISYANLAGIMGVTPKAIRDWRHRTNKKPVKYEYIHKLARYFRLNEEWLYANKNVPKDFAKVRNRELARTKEKYKAYGALIQVIESLGYEVLPDLATHTYSVITNTPFDESRCAASVLDDVRLGKYWLL